MVTWCNFWWLVWCIFLLAHFFYPWQSLSSTWPMTVQLIRGHVTRSVDPFDGRHHLEGTWQMQQVWFKRTTLNNHGFWRMFYLFGNCSPDLSSIDIRPCPNNIILDCLLRLPLSIPKSPVSSAALLLGGVWPSKATNMSAWQQGPEITSYSQLFHLSWQYSWIQVLYLQPTVLVTLRGKGSLSTTKIWISLKKH